MGLEYFNFTTLFELPSRIFNNDCCMKVSAAFPICKKQMLGHVCTAMFLSVINEIFSNKLHCFYKKSIHECVRSFCIISTKITIKVSGIIGATSYFKPGLVGCDYQSKLMEPRHEIANHVVCATSKASDQPAHTRSLIRAFASRLYIL